jgi:hypothetical protein
MALSSSAARRFSTLGRVLLAALAVSLAAGCAQTRQRREVVKSGFLKDYSQLRPGEGDEAQLIYVSPEVDFAKYNKALIDSVTLWAKEDSQLGKVPKHEQQALADYYYHTMHKALAKTIEIADRAGPGVLRIRMAITEAEDSNVTLDVVTSVIPQLRLLTTLGGLATDTALIVGEAGTEVEVTDSVSGEVLAAGVDRRMGTKSLRGVFSDWNDVEKAFDYWAERMAKKLAKLRGVAYPEE